MYNPNNLYGMNGLQMQVPNSLGAMQNNQEIIRVHGEEGAKAFGLGPNSSVLLMDETDNIVWAKVTDGAGYATLRGFRITPIETTVAAAPSESVQYVSTKEFNDLKKVVDALVEELNG